LGTPGAQEWHSQVLPKEIVLQVKVRQRM